MELSAQQFSAYDERPGFPKNSGQGHLFRNQAPAMGDRQRYARDFTPQGERLGKTMFHGTIANLAPGDEIKPRSQTGIDARNEGASVVGMGAAQHNANAHTFASHDYDEAKRYAQDAADVHKERTGKIAEPKVYPVRMRAQHSERDPEYYGTRGARTKSLDKNYFDTPHGESVAEHHGQIGEDATAGNHFRFDDSGNFLAHRSTKPLRVTGRPQF